MQPPTHDTPDSVDNDQGGDLLVNLKLWTTLKNTLVRYYDDIGKIMLANMLWFLASIPIVTIPAATFGLCKYLEQLLTHKQPPVRTVIEAGFRKYLVRAYLFFALFLAMVALSSVGLIFYLQMTEQFGAVALFLGSIVFVILLFTFMVAFYMPVLIMHQDVDFVLAFKRACILAGAKSLVSALLLVACLCFLMLSMTMLPVFLLLFTPSFCLTMMNAATLLALDELE